MKAWSVDQIKMGVNFFRVPGMCQLQLGQPQKPVHHSLISILEREEAIAKSSMQTVEGRHMIWKRIPAQVYDLFYWMGMGDFQYALGAPSRLEVGLS